MFKKLSLVTLFKLKDIVKKIKTEKIIHILKDRKQDAFLKVNTFPYLAEDYYLHLNQYDFDKHSVIIGSSGTGKSKLISSMMLGLLKAKQYQT